LPFSSGFVPKISFHRRQDNYFPKKMFNYCMKGLSE